MTHKDKDVDYKTVFWHDNSRKDWIYCGCNQNRLTVVTICKPKCCEMGEQYEHYASVYIDSFLFHAKLHQTKSLKIK